MKLIDFIAILGALAWAPHLITLLRNWIAKPKVRIITPESVSLGFTTFGSIFNLHLAFSVEHKDIVISSLKIKLKHETGGEKTFEWKGIQQQIMKMKTADGAVLPYEKDQTVLAMKLNQKDIEERFIKFQESIFRNERYRMESEILKKIAYLKSQNKFVETDFMNSQEMQDLIAFVKQSFYWQAGVYQVSIEIESPEKFHISGNTYEFSLTPLEIEELEKNKNLIEGDYKNMIVPQTDEEYENVQWYWANPVLQET